MVTTFIHKLAKRPRTLEISSSFWETLLPPMTAHGRVAQTLPPMILVTPGRTSIVISLTEEDSMTQWPDSVFDVMTTFGILTSASKAL